MKDFTYNEKISGLNANACSWLTKTGLRETRWILDSEWILFFLDDITYNKWIREK